MSEELLLPDTTELKPKLITSESIPGYENLPKPETSEPAFRAGETTTIEMSDEKKSELLAADEAKRQMVQAMSDHVAETYAAANAAKHEQM
jgi:hypothetical protein